MELLDSNPILDVSPTKTILDSRISAMPASGRCQADRLVNLGHPRRSHRAPANLLLPHEFSPHRRM
jgi:hypothetical protein